MGSLARLTCRLCPHSTPLSLLLYFKSAPLSSLPSPPLPLLFGFSCLLVDPCPGRLRRRRLWQDLDMLLELVSKLTDMGFITDKLAMPEGAYKPGISQSYMGICKLPGEGRLHRRLDIKLYPTCVLCCCAARMVVAWQVMLVGIPPLSLAGVFSSIQEASEI